MVLGCLLWAAAPLFAQPLPSQQPTEAAASAEASSASAAETGDAAPALPDTWFETRIEILELAEAGDYAAALALGPRLLALAALEFGPGSAGVAQAHLLLASAHNDNGDYLAAQASILQAIDIYELAEGPLSVTLIDPYLELGDNYYAANDFPSAMSAYTEARTIGRRAYGLLNEDQLPIIDQMSNAAVRAGEFDEANDLQVEAVALIERSYDEFSREAIDARYKYAAWLREQRRFPDERQQYYQILRIAERYFEDDPRMQIRALRERANSFRSQGLGDNLGLSGLRDALDIARDLPEPDPLALAEVLRDIGDWDVAFSRVGASGEAYVEAWTLLGQLENGDEIRGLWFDELIIVSLGTFNSQGLSRDPNAPWGRVVVRFTVDLSGRASNIAVTESNPAGFKDAAAIRQIASSRFRPQIVNGVLSVTRRALALDFQYEPAGGDADEIGEEGSADPAESAPEPTDSSAQPDEASADSED